MVAPEKINVQPNAHDRWFEGDKPNENFVEYIRKDIVDNMLKTAEDHAYFAGSEAMQEKMMAKAIDGEVGCWNLRGLSVNVDLPSTVEEGDKVKVILIKGEEI